MNIKILEKYLKRCQDIGLKPTWEGLKVFKNKFRRIFNEEENFTQKITIA